MYSGGPPSDKKIELIVVRSGSTSYRTLLNSVETRLSFIQRIYVGCLHPLRLFIFLIHGIVRPVTRFATPPNPRAPFFTQKPDFGNRFYSVSPSGEVYP